MSFLRIYYKLNITLMSPLSISSGSDANTDKDVILDSEGNPFIPATSLTGILRSYVNENYGRAITNTIFGFTASTKEESLKAEAKDPEYTERKSLVSVYDGLMTSGKEKLFITNRDMVALENKVGKKGAKFDMEAVEPGTEFTAYIELKDSNYEETVEESLSAMKSGIIRPGSKTSRGYGKVSLKVSKKQFSKPDDWLDFDMTDCNAWSEKDVIQLKDVSLSSINLKLKSKGGISIREYTTEPSTEEEVMPDYMSMGLHIAKDDKDNSVPVIPGTSWAGAFRDRYKEISGKENSEKLFGFVHNKKDDGDDKTLKSSIIFGESQLSGGEYKTTTRNSIDRFTGGTKNGALYTEKTYYYGVTELNISFTRELEENEKNNLAFCLADLHNGFLAVGGLTSIGRGLFEIVEINGKALENEEKKPENIYNAILKGAFSNE